MAGKPGTSDIDEAPDFDYQGPEPPFFDTGEEVSFKEVDRTIPEGGPAPWSTLYTPSIYKGAIEGLGFLVDLPTMALNYLIKKGFETAGFEETAERFDRPLLLSDIGKEVFEAPATIERAIRRSDIGLFPSGEEPVLTAGFSATPREARTRGEQFGADVAYMLGASGSFPFGLAGATGKFAKETGKLLADAGGRNLHSTLARATLENALKVGTPNPVRALAQGADQYASRFAAGLGARPLRTISGELILGTGSGVGFGSPEFLADHEGQIIMDLPGLGEVDVKPSLKILAAMGLPVVMAHTPTGVIIAGDKTKITPLLERLTRKSRKMGADLLGGLTTEGRYNLASRVWMTVTTDPAFMTEVFLPAVKAGHFRDPATNPPMRILEDGTLVPKYGGINPDTMQALRILGLDDTRLAALEQRLQGEGNNLQARIAEGKRRAELLDETFDLLQTKVYGERVPDEAIPEVYDVVKRVRDNLQTLTDQELGTALDRARSAYQALEPQIGAADASNIAVSMIDDARQASSRIRKELWASDKIGTDAVDASELGDWAAAQLKEAGRNRFSPGYSWYFKLAGRKRLENIGVGDKGEPLKLKDLQGLKDGDVPLTPEEIPENGLFDVFGNPGTITASDVKITELQGWRSDLGDTARAASRNGREKEAHRLNEVRDFIDDNILVEANLIGALTAANLRNMKIAREYSFSQKERWGPNTEIGKLLRGKTEVVSAEFLTKLIKQGPGSGARVGAFQNALNEPQLNITDDIITWEPDPRATLMRGDNPNVIEADLLRRFTTSVPSGKVTQRGIDRFLSDSRYGEAVDRIPGLRERFNNLEEVQAAVDAMSTKITSPTREQIQVAMENGGSIQDVENATLYNIRNLDRLRQGNIAAEYLNADPNVAAEAFIKKALADPNFAESRSSELYRILDTDDSGQAIAGFRAALWNSLRKASLRPDPAQAGATVPGIDGEKLAALRDKLAPFLGKFFGNEGMAYLDDIILGTSLQEPGIRIPLANVPGGVLAGEKGWGTAEMVALGGRTLGQAIGAKLGISGLVATGQGRRISVYLFKTVGEKEIMQHVEDAFRNTEKAAALVERAKQLPTYEPPQIVKDRAERLLHEPIEVGKEVVQGAAGLSKTALSKIKNFLENYSLEAIQRAVRLGLLPAQAESRKIDVETDYQLGPPFIYEDNNVRFKLENFKPSPVVPIPEPTIIDEETISTTPTLASRMPPATAPARPPVAGSTLAQARPFDRLGATGAPRPETMAGLAEVGLPLFPAFGSKGGLASLKKKKKSRQMVY
jgi:hypothetical protein